MYRTWYVAASLFFLQQKVKSDECEFMQTMEKNYYETWWSSKYPLNKKKSRKNNKYNKKSSKRWYIALDREGHRRSGRKSRRTQKFTHFLTRPVDYRKVPFLFEARYVAASKASSPSASSSVDTKNPTLLPTDFENRISLESSSSSSSSEGVVIVIDPSSSSASSLKDTNRVEPDAELRRPRGRTRSHKKRRGGRRKMRRKLARRRQFLQKQVEKQLLQQQRQEISKQVSQVFMVQNP